MENMTPQLVAIPIEDFQKCFQQWKSRMVKDVEYKGTILKEIKIGSQR